MLAISSDKKSQVFCTSFWDIKENADFKLACKIIFPDKIKKNIIQQLYFRSKHTNYLLTTSYAKIADFKGVECDSRTVENKMPELIKSGYVIVVSKNVYKTDYLKILQDAEENKAPCTNETDVFDACKILFPDKISKNIVQQLWFRSKDSNYLLTTSYAKIGGFKGVDCGLTSVKIKISPLIKLGYITLISKGVYKTNILKILQDAKEKRPQPKKETIIIQPIAAKNIRRTKTYNHPSRHRINQFHTLPPMAPEPDRQKPPPLSKAERLKLIDRAARFRADKYGEVFVHTSDADWLAIKSTTINYMKRTLLEDPFYPEYFMHLDDVKDLLRARNTYWKENPNLKPKWYLQNPKMDLTKCQMLPITKDT